MSQKKGFPDDTKKSPSIIDYKSDKSLTSAIEDKFKHSHYAKVLKDILTKCETPINIGLYGRWGVGKSSIVHMLKEEIENGTLADEFIYVEVDTWGLSKDALQQGIIEEINSQLKEQVYKQADIEDILYNQREVTSVDYRSSFRKYWPVGGIILAVGVIILSMDASVDLLTKLSWLGAVSLTAALIPIFKFFEVSSKRIMPKAVSSYQFRRIYEKIVEKQVQQNKKLVVVIDNLDRCDDHVAVSLLGIIQTFMAVKNCINILACDDEAIVNHLRQVHGERYTEREGTEFLSKFFQVTLRIPPFIGENLEQYTQDLMRQRSVPLDPFVRQILISGAIENPRKINQFLNNVVAFYRLAEMKEQDGKLPKDVITKRTDFLTKIIVLRHEWPIFYKMLEKNPSILNNREEVKKWIETIEKSDEFRQIEGLQRFLNVTQFSSVSDITPFLRLNQETFASESDIDEFGLAVNNNDLDRAIEIFKDLDENKRSKYLRKIDTLIEKNANDAAELTLLNNSFVLLGLLEIIDEPSQRKIALSILGNYLSNMLLTHLEKFNHEKLIGVTTEMVDVFSRPIINQYVAKYSSPENFKPEIITTLFKNADKIPTNDIDSLDQKMAEIFQPKEEDMLKIIEDVCSPTWASNNITKPSELLSTMMLIITLDNSEQDNKRVELYKKIQNNIDPLEKKLFIDRLAEIITTGTQVKTALPEKLFEIINDIVIPDKNNGKLLDKLFSSLIESTRQNPNIEQIKKIFEVLFQLLGKFKE